MLPILKPYVGGRELNEGSTERFVLDVDGFTSDDLAQVPQILRFLEGTVRPDILARGEIRPAGQWWHFRRPSLGLRAACQLGQLIAIAQTSNAYGFIFAPGTSILSHKAIGFHSDSYALFAILQSRVHQVWAHFQGSTMKDDPVYTPEDCFETFPLPLAYQADSALKSTGHLYYEFRAVLMKRSQQTLTDTYNSFHDKLVDSAEIQELRRLHGEMDRAVLDAYGWGDVPVGCEFFEEFAPEDEDEETAESGRPVRKKYRYRWPDEVRDDVLTRLLLLNAERAEGEKLGKVGGGADAPGRSVIAASKGGCSQEWLPHNESGEDKGGGKKSGGKKLAGGKGKKTEGQGELDLV